MFGNIFYCKPVAKSTPKSSSDPTKTPNLPRRPAGESLIIHTVLKLVQKVLSPQIQMISPPKRCIPTSKIYQLKAQRNENSLSLAQSLDTRNLPPNKIRCTRNWNIWPIWFSLSGRPRVRKRRICAKFGRMQWVIYSSAAGRLRAEKAFTSSSKLTTVAGSTHRTNFMCPSRYGLFCFENTKFLAMPAPKGRNCCISCTIKCGFGRDTGDFLDVGDIDLALIDTRIKYKPI